MLVRPGTQAAALTAEAVAKSGDHAGMRGRLEQVGTELAAGAIADVTAGSIDAALELTESALDVLRVFKESRRVWPGGTFGLPGQVYESTIRYIAMDARAGVGGLRRGDHLGTALSEEDEHAWAGSRGIARVASLIDRDDLSDGQVRALMGVRLLSQAMLEHRDAMRLLDVMVAADALLGRGARSFELARRWVYFGCGRLTTEGLCGRDRPTCPYLALDPARPADLRRLKQLRGKPLAVVYVLLGERAQALPVNAEGVYRGRGNDYSARTFWLTPSEAWRLPFDSGRQQDLDAHDTYRFSWGPLLAGTLLAGKVASHRVELPEVVLAARARLQSVV